MLLGEKLFWNVRAERFEYSILLRANTADAELATAKTGGAAAEKGQRRESALAQCLSRNNWLTVPWALSPRAWAELFPWAASAWARFP